MPTRAMIGRSGRRGPKKAIHTQARTNLMASRWIASPIGSQLSDGTSV
jgi:hypothetical protein